MKKLTIALTLLLTTVAGLPVNAQRITVTIAGQGTGAYNGEGNPGVTAEISAPYDVCLDAANNVYFTDVVNGRVRKIWASNGMVTTIAGGGTSSADGIPALQAAITPTNMCIDAAGNIFVVDSTANKIRRIDAVTNMITTVAGTGAAGFSGDGGPAVAATFNHILGICIDNANNIYLVDKLNFRVREITAGTGIVNTIAGTGVSGYTGDGGPAVAATLSTPQAICVDASRNVFIADQTAGYETAIREINASTGNISTFAGGAGTMGMSLFYTSATTCWLGDVTGLCCDDSGNIFCNEISCSCRKIRRLDNQVYPVAGNFGIESFTDCSNSNVAYMNYPYGLCYSPATGNVYIADQVNNRIRKLIQETSVPTFAYGAAQLMNICTAGTSAPVNAQLAITDMDSGQIETWTAVVPPVNGMLSGFPYSTASMGTDSVTFPSGLIYTPATTFTGTDSFKVQVSDGVYINTVTIYVVVGGPSGVIALSGSDVCTGGSTTLNESVPGGLWSVTNSNASVTINGLISGISTGIDTVMYSISNSCGTASTSLGVSVTNCSLGAGTVAAPSLEVFPNPASAELNIRWANWAPVNAVVISDITGRDVYSGTITSGSTAAQINISSLDPGVYFLKINNTGVTKFVKE